MLIGGAQLYEQGLARAARLYLTRVALQPEGDAWFPDFSMQDWALAQTEAHAASEPGPAYCFETWTRR
jgi:dihydrofolate reductase